MVKQHSCFLMSVWILNHMKLNAQLSVDDLVCTMDTNCLQLSTPLRLYGLSHTDSGPCNAELRKAELLWSVWKTILPINLLRSVANGAQSVGGWSGAGGVWNLRRDVLPGCGHRSGPGNRWVTPALDVRVSLDLTQFKNVLAPSCTLKCISWFHLTKQYWTTFCPFH